MEPQVNSFNRPIDHLLWIKYVKTVNAIVRHFDEYTKLILMQMLNW